MESQTFECTLCADDFHMPSIVYVNDTDTVCINCIVGTFHDAIEHERNYPIRWGAVNLNIDDFAHIFPADFIQRFKRKAQEYHTMGDRVYCTHQIPSQYAPQPGGTPSKQNRRGNLTLNPIEALTAQSRGIAVEACGGMVTQRLPQKRAVQCYRCNGAVCGLCACPLHVPSDTREHGCVRSPKMDVSSIYREDNRGTEWQACPNCKHPCELIDGCNHMVCETCPEREQFCFECGQKSEGNSLHWLRGIGSCARYPGGQMDGDPIRFDIFGNPAPRMKLVGPYHGVVYIHLGKFAEIYWSVCRHFNVMPRDFFRDWNRRMEIVIEIYQVSDEDEFVWEEHPLASEHGLPRIWPFFRKLIAYHGRGDNPRDPSELMNQEFNRHFADQKYPNNQVGVNGQILNYGLFRQTMLRIFSDGVVAFPWESWGIARFA